MNRHWMDRTLRVRLPIIAAVAVIAYAAAFWISKPEREQVGYAPQQPIPFSHELHVGQMQLGCRMCHVGVETGAQATLPGLNVCMNCHSQVATDKPAIQLLKKHYESGEPFFWKRVHRLPEYVYFDHSVHIAKGFDCSQCHGKVSEMDVVHKAKAQTMASCLECHKGVHEPQPGLDSTAKGPTHCSACHR